MLLHLQTVPARNGTLWIRHGFAIFRRKPLTLIGLLCAFQLVACLMLLVPVIGVVALLVSLPLLSLGFMLATHAVLQQQTPNVGVFLAPLKLTPQRRKSQLLLGASYAAATFAAALLALWVDGGSMAELQRLTLEGAPPEQVAAAASEGHVLMGGLTLMGLAVLIAVPFWHAPALIHWGGQGVMQALFSSTLGVWRNKGAFLVNGLTWAALVMGTGMLCSLLGAVLQLGPQLLPMLVLLPMLLGSTVFYSSLYFTFVDCFMLAPPKDLPGEA
ncbi:BPSS1780 family membrane protein [Pelomonas sp. KK5]|uniref:BPSS1780 family membrane protein n=1 Tax=Pelomonas sp. KK5 TaxID=1855730 RepID=UPI00097BC4F4|nr:BPSS1780 family membrane protein [Pelomonas sp. KK5]